MKRKLTIAQINAQQKKIERNVSTLDPNSPLIFAINARYRQLESMKDNKR